MSRSTLMGLLILAACSRQSAEPPARQKPQPLEPLARATIDAGDEDPLFTVAPFDPVGPPLPSGVTPVQVRGEVLPEVPAEGPVVLAFDEDTYLAQVAPLFERLDDAHREVWLAHPDEPIGFKVTLRDTASFQKWIDEPVPGKVRVIQRQEGFELKTNLGKLPGQDPNGPTVTARGGKMDLLTLQHGFQAVQGKFKEAPDVCFVPSFGTELAQTIRALAVDYFRADGAYFKELCLVYSRPVDPAQPKTK